MNLPDLNEQDHAEQAAFPVQVNRISSGHTFYSGIKSHFPSMREDTFVYIFPVEATTAFGSVFIESPGILKLSEYNFGSLFSTVGNICIEFHLPFHDLFQAALTFKWPSFDFDYDCNIYTERRIAIYEFANTDYWPPVLAWFSWQCLLNGIHFFEHVKLLGDDFLENDYGTVFA